MSIESKEEGSGFCSLISPISSPMMVVSELVVLGISSDGFTDFSGETFEMP